jgi:hypothetical protein
VEERDSRLQQPNRRGKGSVVRASQEDGESNRGSIALLTICLYQTKRASLAVLLSPINKTHPLIGYKYSTPCFSIKHGSFLQ